MLKMPSYFKPSLIFTGVAMLATAFSTFLMHKETYEEARADIAEAVEEAKNDMAKALPTEEERTEQES